ncbi:MarR family transcriptional regulator [Kitasatospora sp. NPDC096077]|uniref:MarR family winged helix-turn-helix transcriptional regulator n=1 Tax=Kitasatospora sp. NPDC096077 TaxID=3155544 RepID=UPI00331F46B2
METPSNLPEDAGEVFRRYLGAVVLHSQASADAVGLGATDAYALNALQLKGPMTSGELSVRTGLTTGATTRLIDRLERAGYVRRSHPAEDRRKVIVQAVAQPTELDAVLAPARRRLGHLFEGLTAEQLATLFDYFGRAAEALEEATEELHAAR